MRWFHLTLITLFVLAIIIFAFQNFQIVSVAFLGLGISAPLALVVAIVYVLGMATGGSLWASLRWSLQGSKQP